MIWGIEFGMIERVHLPSRRDFQRRLLKQGKPVILTGEPIAYGKASDPATYLASSQQKQMTIEEYLRVVDTGRDTGE